MREPIYSRWAIVGFCMFFSPVFGGFMLRQNLVDIGQKKASNLFLLLSFLMASFTALVAGGATANAGLVMGINLVQGIVLAETAFKKYFQDDVLYPKKGVGKPLAISMLVICFLMLLMVITNVPLPAK